MESPLRIGFVGCGMVAELHARAIARSPRARLEAIFDPDRTLSARRAKEWSCRSHQSYSELLSDDDVDAVFVLAPTRHHVELAVLALEAGRPVLVEKPVAASLKELGRLTAAAESTGLVCMPGHNYAYVPELDRIRRVARCGDIGVVRLLAITFAIRHAEDVAAHYDGVVRLVLPHHAYLAFGLLGLPARVQAGVTEPGWASLDRHDQAWAVLDYPPHATGLLFASLGVGDESQDPWTFTVKVLGTEGSLTASWNAGIVHRAIGSHAVAYLVYEESYERELDVFCSAAAGDASGVVSPLEHAIACEQIVAAIEEASETGMATPLRKPHAS